MSCPRDAVGLWYAYAMLWVCGKNKNKIIWRKTVPIHHVFQEKITKLNS
jgi:hypothetical protein